MDVNFFDIGIAVIILITALIGFMRGIVWMSVFIATWAAAIFFAIKYKDQLATALPIKLGSDFAQTGLSALLIFLGILIAGAILNALLYKILNACGLGAFDRILGTGLGIVLGILATTLLTMLLGLTELPDQKAWEQSKFIPKFQEAATWLKTKIPEDMNKYIDDTLGRSNETSTTAPTTDSIISPTESDNAESTPSAN
jgi:membrane protein required for colicin V production